MAAVPMCFVSIFVQIWDSKDNNQLWIGRGGSLTPCHYDKAENLHLQIQGQKSFLLIPPEQTFATCTKTVDGLAVGIEMLELRRSHVFLPVPFRIARNNAKKRFTKTAGLVAKAVYPYPIDHPLDSFSMVDFDAPDLQRFWACLEPPALMHTELEDPGVKTCFKPDSLERVGP